MKIAIFGGSFNPVHNEHINIVKAAITCLELDKLIVMPTFITPSKEGRICPSPQDRLNMCRLAFSFMPKVEVSDFEISNGGTSYSYLTCRAFKQKYPQAERFFIIGGDMLEKFEKWKYPQEILKCVTLAVCAREDEDKLNEEVKKFTKNFLSPIKIINYIGGAVSSTRLRVYAALGESLDGLTDEKVAKYIENNALYRIDFAQKVKNSMSAHRWKHTLGVAVAAAKYCSSYGVSEKDAIVAALLHDCGKEISLDSQTLSGCKLEENIPPPVVHQFTGAYLAEHLYGIKDEKIINAIRYHCSGRANMTPIEKLIFLSDMLEEGRDFEGVQTLRDIFNRDKQEGLIAALDRQLEHVNKSGLPVYYLTQQAYDYLKEHKDDK